MLTYAFGGNGVANDLAGGPVLYAALNPAEVISLSAVSGPVQVAGSTGAATVRESLASVRSAGLRTWAEESMDSRLGFDVTAVQRAWWTDLMASTDERAVLGCLDAFSELDLRDSLPRIVAPTLFLTTKAIRSWRWTASRPRPGRFNGANWSSSTRTAITPLR